MADQTTTVRLENKTAHLKHLALGGGESLAIPPTESGPGVEIKLESDDERKRFNLS